MAFDGLVSFSVVRELKNCIIDGKIDKIFEPNSNEILLGVYSNGIKYLLDIVVSSNYYRTCLTTSPKANPSVAPNFCMLLRKHLLNTRVTNINTSSLERIITIEFEGLGRTDEFVNKKMIIELMGKHSNIILVNSDNVIIDALRHFSIQDNSYRNILPNFKYVLPISNKLDFTAIQSEDEFYSKTVEYLKDTLNISENLDNLNLSDVISDSYTGISKTSAISICKELEIENTFSKDNMNKFYNYLSEFLNDSSNVTIQAISEKDYSISLGNKKEEPLQINYFLDDYYSTKESLDTFTTYRNNLSKLILNHMKKLNNKLSNINRKLDECKNTDLYRLYGELITNNLYRISKEHSDKIEIENYYDNNNLITIPLDKAISPSMNAKHYFKKYNKLKNAKTIVEEQKKEVQSEIDYLESIIYEFRLATTVSDIDNIYNEFSEAFLTTPVSKNSKTKNSKKKTKQSKKDIKTAAQFGEPLKYKIDNFTVLVGKNNKQNDYITKHADSNDIWFHNKNIHGSHVILKTNNQTPSQETINKCASLAAFHSKAYQSSNVSIDYTLVKYVKKPSNAKPGMVIYTNYKNVIVKPMNVTE